MKAIVVTVNGPAYADAPMPEPNPRQVLIKVQAAALNRADVIMAGGAMHGSHGGPGTVLGLECAGIVERVGDQVEGIAPGDRVMASSAGGLAEYAVTDFSRVTKIADSVDFASAACYPVALQTMHDAIVTQGEMKPGKAVLIQGASAGVGLMGLQIAKLKGASVVIGTSTNAERRARLSEFGADLALNTQDADWPERVREATDGKGADIVIDQISGGLIDQTMEATAVLGRIVNVGRLGGQTSSFNHDLHALKRISYIGVTFRTRSVEEVAEINRRMRADILPALEAGELRLPIDKRFPHSEGAAALEHMRQNLHFGKIVLMRG
jgi:NADPH2:quinone reductase